MHGIIAYLKISIHNYSQFGRQLVCKDRFDVPVQMGHISPIIIYFSSIYNSYSSYSRQTGETDRETNCTKMQFIMFYTSTKIRK